MTTTALDISSGIKAVLKRSKRRFPQHVNRISALDDPCVRRLYYMRTAWDKPGDIDDRLQGIFNTGNALEPVIERIVSEVGAENTPRWRIVGQQMTTNDGLLKKYQISGTIDGLLQIEQEPGRWVTVAVVDIKTMSANVYATIHDYDSLSRYPWTRKYRGQVMLYALAHNIEGCCLLLVNKQNLYDMKLLSFPVDMAYCEELLQKAEAVNKAIETNEPPPQLSDPDECPRCAWFSFCCPPVSTGGNLQVVDNAELEAILDRIDELSPASEELSELEARRDALLTKGSDIACGRWLVKWKHITIQYKAKPACTGEQWRKSITKREPSSTK